MLGVQRLRPSLYDLREQLAAMAVPTLVITGDEDEPCLDPGLMLKRTIPTARLAVLPGTGHALNLEEPALFNRLVGDFWRLVESGRYAATRPAFGAPRASSGRNHDPQPYHARHRRSRSGGRVL